MLSCELCCSFRADRLKKTLLFSDALSGVGGSRGFPCECPPRCPAQLGGSQITICLPRLRPAGVRFALLLQALPFCCGLRRVATVSALLPWATPCSRVSLLYQVASATAGYVSNWHVPQWGLIALVMADALPPRSCALRKSPHQEGLESLFCLSHCASPNTVSLGFPGLAHCPSPVQSQVQPSQVSVCQFNRAPVTVRFCMERCGAPLRSSAGRSRTGCWLYQL